VKKNAPHDANAGRGNEGSIPFTAAAPFRIIKLERCSFGMKVAVGVFEIEGLGEFSFEVFAPPSRPLFVMPASIRNRYTGAYERVFKLEDDFRSELLSRVEQRLGADD